MTTLFGHNVGPHIRHHVTHITGLLNLLQKEDVNDAAIIAFFG
jgi:hypothetical protein